MNTQNPNDEQWNERSNAGGSLLRDTEPMFRLLFERSADAMSLFDPQTGRFIESNEAVARQTGAPSMQALGSATPAEISPERQPDGQLSNEKAAEMVRLALAHGSHRFEWLSRRHDGTELPLDVVMTAIPVGERTLLFTVSRDISKHKKAEQEILRLNTSLEQRVAERTQELLRTNQDLQRAEQELRQRSGQVHKHRDALLDLAQAEKSDFNRTLQKICSVAAGTLDVARVSYWSLRDNDSAIVCELLQLRGTQNHEEAFFGARVNVADCPAYFEALAVKRPLVAHDVLTHPATTGLVEKYLKPRGISSMLDAPVWVRGEMVGVLCHEHTGPAREWTAEEVDFASALATMVSLALEESNRARSEQTVRESEARLRESEARFSTAFHASPALITISRLADSKFIVVNDAFARWIGLKSDEIAGHSSQELGIWANENERTRFVEELRRTHSVRDFECQLRSQRGTQHTMLLSADVIEINREPHVLVFRLDITQRKQAEAELLRTLAREKELGQLRSNFVSMVSHEFRTPLGIIQSSAEILEDYLDRLEPTERAEHLRSIKNNTHRMAALMEEVLLIGSFDAGKMDFKPAPLDLQSFTRQLVDEVLSATDQQCPIELVMADAFSNFRADERLLRHIFTNLLTNAVKYSATGKPVQFEIEQKNSEMVCVIRDQGIGIPEADREWLFNAFHRGRNVGDRHGTGLGLVIVKRCVDLHGGKIKVDSKLGGGTVVTLRLPMESAAAKNVL